MTVWDATSYSVLALFQSGKLPTHNRRGNSTDKWTSSWTTNVVQGQPGSGEGSFREEDGGSDDPGSGLLGEDRNPAKKVIWSPAGAQTQLLVFAEVSSSFYSTNALHLIGASQDNTQVHIIDARTLTQHEILTVPDPRGNRDDLAAGPAIVDLAFDSTGNWLYVSTEDGVFEWNVLEGC